MCISGVSFSVKFSLDTEYVKAIIDVFFHSLTGYNLWHEFPLCFRLLLLFLPFLVLFLPCDKVYLALDLEFEFDVRVVVVVLLDGIKSRGSWRKAAA